MELSFCGKLKREATKGQSENLLIAIINPRVRGPKRLVNLFDCWGNFWRIEHCITVKKQKKSMIKFFDTDFWFDTEFFDFTHLYLSLSRVKSCTSMVFSLWFIGSKISLMPSFVKLMTKSTFNGSWNKQVQTCST